MKNSNEWFIQYEGNLNFHYKNMTIQLNTSYGSVSINDIDPNKGDDWKVIKSDQCRPDRGQFLLEKFYEDFPNLKDTVDGIELLSKLCSRSAMLGNWLREANVRYILEIAPPLYLRNAVKAEDYDEAFKSVRLINASNKTLAEEQGIIVSRYKVDMAKAVEKQKKLIAPLKKNNLVNIITMNSTSLPVTLQAMIEKYTPTSSSASPDRDTYAREVLISFKIALVNFYEDPVNKKIDFDDLIRDLSEK